MSLFAFAPFADLNMLVRLTGLFPLDVFIVSPINQRVDLSAGIGSKQNPAFDTFAEKNLWCFREQLLFFAVSFDEQLISFGNDRPRLAAGQFICANVLREFFWIRFPYGGVFVVAMCLAGDDLPVAVALQPGVGDVISCFQFLPEDRFGFVSIVTENRSVSDNAALRVFDFYCS